MGKKKMTVANFNIVFGTKEEPLLDYFDTIIMPALSKETTIIKKDPGYRFLNVEVIDSGNDDFVLTGVIVKNTTLEVLSKIDGNGNLVEANELHPSAPYSLFSIFLKNHRMVLVKNQKGSPDIRFFASAIKSVLKNYIRVENTKRKEEEQDLLPYPIINIIGIPMKGSIEEALKKVSQINKLTLRFYPLNGDLDFTDIFEGMATDLRKMVGSKTGSVVLNSPTSKSGIIEVITAAQGTVDPIIEVTYPDKSTGRIRNGILSENLDITYNDSTVENAINEITTASKRIESIAIVSEGNREIYETNKSNIIPFVKRK
ncbi:hypothetical protein J2T12_000121 [Paenibacillus anaericanus]|uniref:hypothetical protein n=1 Tax=Paenibacillus anaericanus TaxID=170367 RepID=UPI00277D4946|nr:hypothetical protein [Paenibacillus anaericanus]MDQ0086727.1 hypothetical protein [Paenibacillus anaericanus]